MTKVPNLGYEKVINALKRDGCSHIRMQKRTKTEVLKITIPAHRPIKRSTFALAIALLTIPIYRAETLLAPIVKEGGSRLGALRQ